MLPIDAGTGVLRRRSSAGFRASILRTRNAYIEVVEDSVQAIVKHDLLGERLPLPNT